MDFLKDLFSKLLKSYFCNTNSKLLSLPDEMIIEIISHLNEIDDIKSCMLVSKQFRYIIFNSPKIMRNVQFTFKNSATNDEVSSLLLTYGHLIKNIKIKTKPLFLRKSDPNIQLAQFILSHTPNLESFYYFPEEYGCLGAEKDSILLPQLRSLTILSKDIENFKTFSTNIKSLSIRPQNLHKINFHDVKELELMFYSPEKLSHQDLNLLKELKLVKLKISKPLDEEFDENTFELIKSQATTLEDLSYSGELYEESIDYILSNFKNLNSLSLSCENINLNQLLNYPNPNWMLPKLKHFSGEYVNLKLLYSVFTNITSVRCAGLLNCCGTYNNLKSLTVSILACESTFLYKLPNLKKLTISHNIYGNYWLEFVKIVPNLEHIEIWHFRSIEFFTEVLLSLKIALQYWSNFRTFKIIKTNKKNMILMDFHNKIIKFDRKFVGEKKFLKFVITNFPNLKISYFC